jgi:hypothetical protein
MSNGIGIDELVDETKGSSIAYSGTATVTPAGVPGTADKTISGASIWNRSGQNLELSFDGGTTYFSLERKSFVSHAISGEIDQVFVKTLSGTADYEMVINFRDY